MSRPGAPEVSGRVIGTDVRVRATNHGTTPGSVTLTTPYGSRTVTDVAPGRQACQSFNARAASIPAGAAGATTAHSTSTAAYAAITCG